MTRLGTGLVNIKTVSSKVQQEHEQVTEYPDPGQFCGPVSDSKLPPPTVNQDDDSPKNDAKYWRLAFAVVGAPLLLLGFPAHLLAKKSRKNTSKDDSRGKRKLDWIRGVLFPDNFAILIATLILLSVSTYFCLYFFTAVWLIFNYLVIQGELGWNLIVNLAIFIRTLPAIVPLISTWAIGYSYRDAIASFDEFRANFVRRLKLRPRGKTDFKHPGSTVGFWVRLGFIYFAIVCIHGIPILSDGWKTQHWTSIWIGLFYRFIPPIYCMCCWVLASEFQILSGFLTAILKDDCAISTEAVHEIKDCIKKTTNHVTYVNKKLGKYVSWWIFPVFGFSTVSHLVIMILYLLGTISLQTIALFLGLVGEWEDEGGSLFTPTSDLVRSAVAHTFVGFLEVGLVGFMVRQAIAVNDESRFAHVLINEVLGDHSLPVIKNEELYGASRHLKFYMYMTHEHDNPALMMLPILRSVPFLGYRLHTSKLRNPPLHRRFLNEIV